MTLRKQLESLSQQLASFHDEQLDRFEPTYHAIREAHELALEHRHVDVTVMSKLWKIADRYPTFRLPSQYR